MGYAAAMTSRVLLLPCLWALSGCFGEPDGNSDGAPGDSDSCDAPQWHDEGQADYPIQHYLYGVHGYAADDIVAVGRQQDDARDDGGSDGVLLRGTGTTGR